VVAGKCLVVYIRVMCNTEEREMIIRNCWKCESCGANHRGSWWKFAWIEKNRWELLHQQVRKDVAVWERYVEKGRTCPKCGLVSGLHDWPCEFCSSDNFMRYSPVTTRRRVRQPFGSTKNCETVRGTQ